MRHNLLVKCGIFETISGEMWLRFEEYTFVFICQAITKATNI